MDQPSSSVETPSVSTAALSDVTAGTSEAHLHGMRDMIRVMGNVPDSILNSNSKEDMPDFFQGRMIHGRSGGGPVNSSVVYMPAYLSTI